MTERIRDHIRRMAAYVPGEQPDDPEVLKLNTNENPYPPSPAVARALANVDPARLRLYPDPVCLRLRRKLAALHGVEVEQVIVGNGSDELLALCTRAFAAPGDAAAWLDPSYSLYPVLAEIADLKPCPVPLGPRFEWAESGEDVNASLFFLTSPNAPTGIPHDRKRVERFARSFLGVLVLDEAYADFSDDPPGDLAAVHDNVLAVRTLSKSYSLAGVRLGYAFGPAELIGAMFKIKDSYNVDALAQVLAEAAVDDQAHMRANTARIVKTRAATVAALLARGFEVAPTAANFLWARPPGGHAAALFEALRGRKVLVRYFPGARTGEHLRITIGTDEQMTRLLAEIDAAREG